MIESEMYWSSQYNDESSVQDTHDADEDDELDYEQEIRLRFAFILNLWQSAVAY